MCCVDVFYGCVSSVFGRFHVIKLIVVLRRLMMYLITLYGVGFQWRGRKLMLRWPNSCNRGQRTSNNRTHTTLQHYHAGTHDVGDVNNLNDVGRKTIKLINHAAAHDVGHVSGVNDVDRKTIKFKFIMQLHMMLIL